MASRNLLITIIDTNPVWWGLQSTGALENGNTTNGSTNSVFTLTECLSAIVAFLNAYKSMNQNNSVVVLAAHNTKADYIYPTRDEAFNRNMTPWDRFDQISDMDEQIRSNLKLLVNEQLDSLNQNNENETLVQNDAMITSALGHALCYINRIQRKITFTEEVKYRILVIKGCEDSANQYMNFMNMIFSSEKLNVVIDACILGQDSSLLQQACNLTNGQYFRIPKINGLLTYLLWLFLPDIDMRTMLVYPPKTQVDYRAACFCHRKLIDVGYVCSVCLSVFCSFTPICSTCNCNFQFDVSVFKRAMSLKKGSFSAFSKQQQTQQSSLSSTGSSSQSQMSLLPTDEYATSSLTNQFQDASLSSPLSVLMTSGGGPMSVASASASNEPFETSNEPQIKIVTAATTTSRSSNGVKRPANPNDSFDMFD